MSFELPDVRRDEDEPIARRAPEFLCDEEGDVVWIRGDLAESHGEARYKALTGRGLPFGFWEAGLRLIDLNCRVQHMRDVSLDHDPPTSGLRFLGGPWHRCAPDAPGAVGFWEVSVR